jgi:hypothetical protein
MTLVNIIAFGPDVEEDESLSLIISDEHQAFLEEIKKHAMYFNKDGHLQLLHMALLEGLNRDSSADDNREFLVNYAEEISEEISEEALHGLLDKVRKVHPMRGYVSSTEMYVINCFAYID